MKLLRKIRVGVTVLASSPSFPFQRCGGAGPANSGQEPATQQEQRAESSWASQKHCQPSVTSLLFLPLQHVGPHLLDLHLDPPGSQQLPLLNRTCGGDTGSERLSCLRSSYHLMSHGRLKKSVWIWCSEVKLCRPIRASPQSIVFVCGTFFCCFETSFSPPSRCLTERKYAVHFRTRERSILTHVRSYAQFGHRGLPVILCFCPVRWVVETSNGYSTKIMLPVEARC